MTGKIASLIADEFYDLWFRDEAYADSRVTFEAYVEHVADPLKYEMAKHISAHDPLEEDWVAEELDGLSRVHVNGVITTNWDTLLEARLRELEVFVGQQDVLFATTQAIGEIYKIHGSVTDPKSLIVTSEDYAVYWDRNPYLIAKLLTMLVEHPVLFLGYGLGDAHINTMLENLIACLTVEQIEVLNDRLVFVRRAHGGEVTVLQRGSMTVGAHTLSIREYVCSDFLEFFEMLGSLPERFPAKLLRRLRQSVYELTFSTEPTGRVHVLSLDQDEDVDDVEIVVGVGTMERLGERGYSSLGRADICRDMLTCETDHNADRLVSDLLSQLLRSAKFVPVYYPLYLAGRVNEDGTVPDTAGLPANGKSLISGGTKLTPYVARDLPKRKTQNFRDLLALNDPNIAMEYGLVCQYELEDAIQLRDFLLERVPDADSVPTPLAKLCCKYDHLVYGPGFSGDRGELHGALGVSRRRRRRRGR